MKLKKAGMVSIICLGDSERGSPRKFTKVSRQHQRPGSD